MHSGDQSEIHPAILAFLTSGHAQITDAKFINQIRRKYVGVTECNVAAAGHDLVPKTRHESFIQIAIAVWLERHHVGACKPAKHRVMRSDGVIETHRELMAVILDGRRRQEILDLAGRSGQRHSLKECERDRVQSLCRDFVAVEWYPASSQRVEFQGIVNRRQP